MCKHNSRSRVFFFEARRKRERVSQIGNASQGPLSTQDVGSKNVPWVVGGGGFFFQRKMYQLRRGVGGEAS